jgi:DNA-binding NtrC family response regulator
MRARLTIEQGKGIPAVLNLAPFPPVTLGRSRENTVILHDEHASRQHAQIYFDQGQWFVRDLDTLNGTYVDNTRITEPATLADNQVIGIADMRLRFSLLEEISLTKTPPQFPVLEAGLRMAGAVDQNGTSLWADELATLYEYMIATVEEKDAAAVVERTLQTVARKTRATVCGFLNLDPDNPLSKKVYPQSAEVDAQLSRHLTVRVQQTGRTAWLMAGAGEISSSDSLASYRDALCVPLKADGTALGALHVYREQGGFSQREVRFCEVVAGFAASSLTLLRLCRSLEAENSRLRLHTPVSEEIIGSSPAMQTLRQAIARAAASSATVLIHGETGAGKELVALALHRRSPRCNGPLVVANCGAIAESLLESELFGHCKGAFTGAAANRSGLFQQADDGTIFLDEIGEMPLESQVKLLRAIEGQSFRPLGATRDVRVDVRVLAATNRNLEREVKEGRFRQDLYFRLRVIYIAVPPLREHAEDIPELVEYLLRKIACPNAPSRKITPATLARLAEYSWPGNIRQLRSVLENAAIMGEGDTIDVCDLSLPDMTAPPATAMTLADLEAWGIRRALDKTAGNVSQAAKTLGIGRDTLAKKIKQYRLGEGTLD